MHLERGWKNCKIYLNLVSKKKKKIELEDNYKN